MIINLTPHPIHLYGPIKGPLDDPDETLPPSGKVARIACIDLGTNSRDGASYQLVEYGHVHDLPPRRDGTLYVVSLVVALACHRDDLLAPYDEVRNSEGTMIG